MKIDRLLGILIYLLNRETVSGRSLAEKFEVSSRTIQRDIETLSMAGIPVTSTQGTHGGYSIINSFKMNRQVFSTDDYVLIITALKGLCSAYESRQIEATFEKLLSLSPKDELVQQSIHLDFSVLREGFDVRDYLTSIETAIRKRVVIEFQYTNAEHFKSRRFVEPVAVTYKWYSWYLFGFCCEKQEYRMFRLSRIRDLKLTCQGFSNVHDNAEELLAEKQDTRPYMNIKLACQSDIRISIEESFPNSRITETSNNELMVEFSVPENERGWFGTLLGYGNKVTVLEPEKLKHTLITYAKDILQKYC
ncbi:Predicted DNA-binding transcriptional regulator YafY, contains an HTH and WYL domains [Paenibacillus uliginis N3/975]|uniref:Predicted DNA-binding transcriptional regulator YafY, contains an HTH and WYL domains n=1 Tax=Paenibacillus uliginis N3/975 TaxID=1313296 RepID=A0A1X7G5A9_9BACL|nr:YafY family protein [Paenibacillus uliginis]SMF64281.1 Predicted DNA-binding transcriptional regulator YafY, contains an HTH and WYL domains [Paenibacillus uliginis N3/975]